MVIVVVVVVVVVVAAVAPFQFPPFCGAHGAHLVAGIT